MSDTQPNTAKASSLGIRPKALSLTFQYVAARKYTTPTGRPLTGVARNVFEVLMREEHTTMQEIGSLHDRTNLGAKSIPTITKAMSRLRERMVSVHGEDKIQREPVEDPNSADTSYSRYSLSPEFKLALVREARDFYRDHSSYDVDGIFGDIPGLDEVA